ncbi:hypothetical protein BLNAU_13868 [Blattamonas nauphoetae]|uniref:Uncharacterized protein n=1 Tax=Blattamonas nauphoetae TaxID=2049346 RepID=A0ABQ9XKW6_9EUKA|nr:hypothetical protein BLNAU_13868 [Blattamonas nauphoetae]
MKMINALMTHSSAQVLRALINCDLIPQLINTLNLPSLSFDKAVDIHIYLMSIVTNSVWLSTPNGLEQLGIEDEDEQQAVHETDMKEGEYRGGGKKLGGLLVDSGTI